MEIRKDVHFLVVGTKVSRTVTVQLSYSTLNLTYKRKANNYQTIAEIKKKGFLICFIELGGKCFIVLRIKLHIVVVGISTTVSLQR